MILVLYHLWLLSTCIFVRPFSLIKILFVATLFSDDVLSDFFVQFALPHILGWDHIVNQPLAGASISTKAEPLVKDLEWDR